MQNLLLIPAAILLGVGFLAALFSVRERLPSKRHFWSLIGSVSFLAGTGLAIAWLFTLSKVPVMMMIIVVILAVLGAVFWSVLLIAGRREGHGLEVIEHHLRLAATVALPGWKNMDARSLLAEDQREAKRIDQVMTVGAAMVIFPGIVMTMAASIVMNVRGSSTSDFLAHSVGFYTLLIATCWTSAYVITIFIVSVVQLVRRNGSGLDLPAVAMSLGKWAGLGAALAVFVGALIPLVVVPLSQGEFKVLGMSLLDSVSPSLLLDISTAGAVYGFLVGEVISIVNISSKEQNLYVKTALPPLLFASMATILGLIGLTPGRLSKSLSNEYTKMVLTGHDSGADPFATALSEGLDTQQGWANVVVGLDQHGWNNIVDNHIYYAMTWIIAILVALFSMTVHIRRRELELVAMDRKLPPKKKS